MDVEREREYFLYQLQMISMMMMVVYSEIQHKTAREREKTRLPLLSFHTNSFLLFTPPIGLYVFLSAHFAFAFATLENTHWKVFALRSVSCRRSTRSGAPRSDCSMKADTNSSSHQIAALCTHSHTLSVLRSIVRSQEKPLRTLLHRDRNVNEIENFLSLALKKICK
jgi:hypothetical protein